MSETPQDRVPGAVPHTFRLRMAWQWVPRMPRELRRQKAFLFALQTVAAMADTAGRTRWHVEGEDDAGRPLRLKELAAAMGSDEKDARRYLAAAIAAGVLTTERPPKRGRTTVYVLLLPPSAPRWEAALAVLAAGAETTVDDDHTRAASFGEEFGGASPVPARPAARASSGDASPNFGARSGVRERGTVPRWSSGDGSPSRTGDWPPNKPGISKTNPQERVSVGPQLRDARGHETHERAEEPTSAAARPLRAVDDAPAASPGRVPRPAVPAGQLPLLMPVPEPHGPQQRPADPALGDRRIGAPQDGWRALVARERPADAEAAYRDRWHGDHARHLPGHTGT